LEPGGTDGACPAGGIAHPHISQVRYLSGAGRAIGGTRRDGGGGKPENRADPAGGTHFVRPRTAIGRAEVSKAPRVSGSDSGLFPGDLVRSGRTRRGRDWCRHLILVRRVLKTVPSSKPHALVRAVSQRRRAYRLGDTGSMSCGSRGPSQCRRVALRVAHAGPTRPYVVGGAIGVEGDGAGGRQIPGERGKRPGRGREV